MEIQRFINPFVSRLPSGKEDETIWLYGPYEYEAFRLAQLKKAKDKARLKVGYPGEFHIPLPEYVFRAVLPAGVTGFRFSGEFEVSARDIPVKVEPGKNGETILTLPRKSKVEIHLRTEGTDKEIPSLACANPSISWLCAPTSHGPFVRPYERKGNLHIPPHKEELSVKKIIPKKTEPGFWDVGFELLCYVGIKVKIKPEMFIGESLFEVMNENSEHFEQTCELEEIAPGHWQSIVPLALRYIRLKGTDETAEVELSALHTPACLEAEFNTASPLWNEIWDKSVYTLHLCMHHFLIDGVKRDRLPWGGDLAVSLLANAYTFGVREIVRDTLSVLESAGIRNHDINGIADYSLWLLINHDLYQRYFDDPEFLQREYPRILETIDVLLSRCDDRGFLTDRCKWVFLDWLKMKKTTALQILFYWAMRSARKLAERRNDAKTIERCLHQQEKLEQEIRAASFDSERCIFLSSPNGEADSRHPNIFAILSGLATGEERSRIADVLDTDGLPRVGTPYVAVFEALALAGSGKSEAALKEIEDIWGNMLKLGATTFFEAFSEKETEPENFAFYGRPYGLSCCHAWSAGPAFFFPILFSGLEPVADGWKTFRFSPFLPVREDFFLSVPTPSGLIRVEQKAGIQKISAPLGTKILHEKKIPLG